MELELNCKKLKNNKGAVLPFVAVCMILLLGVVGFVIDLAMREAIIRRAQNAADAAALAGATLLETPEMSTTQEEIDDFANVKKTVLLSIANGDLLGLDPQGENSFCMRQSSCTPTFRYDHSSGSATSYDCSGYNKDLGRRGNITVEARRYIFCYWRDPWDTSGSAPIQRVYLDVENSPDHYCKANAVSVKMTIHDPHTFFMQVLGISSMSDITVDAMAYMEEPIPAPPAVSYCESIDCDAIGVKDLLDNSGLIPANPDPLPENLPTPITNIPCRDPASVAPTC